MASIIAGCAAALAASAAATAAAAVAAAVAAARHTGGWGHGHGQGHFDSSGMEGERSRFIRALGTLVNVLGIQLMECDSTARRNNSNGQKETDAAVLQVMTLAYIVFDHNDNHIATTVHELILAYVKRSRRLREPRQRYERQVMGLWQALRRGMERP